MFIIDTMSQQPVYEQLVTQTERYILLGVLNGGDAMPSVRRLSVKLSVNPNTIQKKHIQSLTGAECFFSVPGKRLLCCRKTQKSLYLFRAERE